MRINNLCVRGLAREGCHSCHCKFSMTPQNTDMGLNNVKLLPRNNSIPLNLDCSTFVISEYLEKKTNFGAP